MDDKYRQYLNSKEWSQLKIDLYEYRGRKCEKCGNTENLEVHHKTYRNIYQEEPEDLIILCKECHTKQHKKGNDFNEKEDNEIREVLHKFSVKYDNLYYEIIGELMKIKQPEINFFHVVGSRRHGFRFILKKGSRYPTSSEVNEVVDLAQVLLNNVAYGDCMDSFIYTQ